MTFDGRHFSFMGACTYILTEDIGKEFSIYTSNVPCGTTGVTCTKSIFIKMPGYEVSLLLGKGWFLLFLLILGTTGDNNNFSRALLYIVHCDEMLQNVLNQNIVSNQSFLHYWMAWCIAIPILQQQIS